MSRAERYLIAALLLTVVGLELYNTQRQPALKPVPDALAVTQAHLEANCIAYHKLMQQKINDLDHTAEMQAIEQVRQEVDNVATQHE